MNPALSVWCRRSKPTCLLFRPDLPWSERHRLLGVPRVSGSQSTRAPSHLAVSAECPSAAHHRPAIQGPGPRATRGHRHEPAEPAAVHEQRENLYPSGPRRLTRFLPSDRPSRCGCGAAAAAGSGSEPVEEPSVLLAGERPQTWIIGHNSWRPADATDRHRQPRRKMSLRRCEFFRIASVSGGSTLVQ